MENLSSWNVPLSLSYFMIESLDPPQFAIQQKPQGTTNRHHSHRHSTFFSSSSTNTKIQETESKIIKPTKLKGRHLEIYSQGFIVLETFFHDHGTQIKFQIQPSLALALGC
jgi:hypothetical protein